MAAPVVGSYHDESKIEQDFNEWSMQGAKPVKLSTTSEALINEANNKPKILLMGLRKSGKSSIRHVVFHKMSANETLFLEGTSKIEKIDISMKCFLQFQIWDFPGLDIFETQGYDTELLFNNAGVLIFVIDPMEDFTYATEKLHTLIMEAYKVNPAIKFEVFIHKSDGLSEEQKIDHQRELLLAANGKLSESGYGDIHLSFHLTSIYDHSIFEVMSTVCQKLLAKILPPFENILNAFVSSNNMEKAFIFDVHPKIYIATDSTSVDMQTYELCCDMIDLLIDVSRIYGVNDEKYASLTYDMTSSSLIQLNNGTALYLKQINKHLALVCLLREDFSEHQGLLDYNFDKFKEGIQNVLAFHTMI